MMYMYVNIKNDFQNNGDKRKKELLLDIWYKKEAIKLFDELIKKYSSLMNIKVETFTSFVPQVLYFLFCFLLF